MVMCTGHIGIHEGVDGRTYGRTLYVRTDVHDVMAIKPNFLASMGYQYFLSYGAPRERAFGARGAPLSISACSVECFSLKPYCESQRMPFISK